MIYLDAAVTVPTSTHVQERMNQVLRESWGNVSGAHSISRSAKNVLEEARERCAKNLGVSPDNVVFTSGATEALNLVIQGYGRKNPQASIFYSAIEHPAVTKPAKYLREHGHKVVELGVDDSGIVNKNELDGVSFGDLVCVMPVNNEIGVVNDVKEIAKIVHGKGGVVLLDCVQSFYVFEPSQMCEYADFAVFSSHKLGGPQGVGLLMVKDRKSIDNLSFGGSQEWELRPGTTPTFLIDAMSFVLEQAIENRESSIEHLDLCEKTCIQAIEEFMPDAKIHAADSPRSPHVVAIDIGNIESQMLVAMIDSRGVCVSRGSACASGAATPSPVLIALGIEPENATSTLRLSFHPGTKIEDVKDGVKIISECVSQLRAMQKVSSS